MSASNHTPLTATAPPALPDAHRWICPECGESPTIDARWRVTGGGPPEHHHGYPVGHIPAEPAVTVYLLPPELSDGQHVTAVTDPQTVADAVKGWCEDQRVYVVCEGCGVAGSLGSHEVAADGVVSPSVSCAACGWHVFVRLEDWPHGLKAAGYPVGGVDG